MAVNCKNDVFGKRFFWYWLIPENIHSSDILQIPPPPKGHLGIKSSWFKFTNILLHKSIHTSNNNSFLQSVHPSSNLHLQASPPFRGWNFNLLVFSVPSENLLFLSLLYLEPVHGGSMLMSLFFWSHPQDL